MYIISTLKKKVKLLFKYFSKEEQIPFSKPPGYKNINTSNYRTNM